MNQNRLNKIGNFDVSKYNVNLGNYNNDDTGVDYRNFAKLDDISEAIIIYKEKLRRKLRDQALFMDKEKQLLRNDLQEFNIMSFSSRRKSKRASKRKSKKVLKALKAKKSLKKVSKRRAKKIQKINSFGYLSLPMYEVVRNTMRKV